MGQYCEVCGVEVKFTGLLSSVARSLERQGRLKGYIEDGVAVLKPGDVHKVVLAMREQLLSGEAAKYCSAWSEDRIPLSSLQDIMRFSTDVQAFELLSLWYADEWRREGKDELVFA